MTTTNETVDQLFSDFQGDNWPERVKRLEHGQVYTRIMKSLTANGGLMNSFGAFGTVAARIPELLRLDLGVILVGGWKKMEELRRYTDRKKYPPDETVLVEVTRHTVTSTHKPQLDIVVNNVKVDTVPFELKLTVTIDGALLRIRDARILSVSPGACKAAAELKCEGFTIVKRESKPVKVPGAWTFKKPIEIERQ